MATINIIFDLPLKLFGARRMQVQQLPPSFANHRTASAAVDSTWTRSLRSRNRTPLLCRVSDSCRGVLYIINVLLCTFKNILRTYWYLFLSWVIQNLIVMMNRLIFWLHLEENTFFCLFLIIINNFCINYFFYLTISMKGTIFFCNFGARRG